MTNFGLLFGVALLFNVVVTFRSSEYYKKWMSGASSTSSTSSSNTKDSDALDSNDAVWQKLLKKYLIVYLLATLSDWLQGPYVYALYDFYQYSQHDIAVLFVAGFGSSMVFGSFVGGMADVGGRKLFTILFAVVYAASCLTKHFKDFYILLLGRLLGGVATSLLFSVFEAWLIRAHADALCKHQLSKSFRWAAYGNSIVAIVAGLLANKSTQLMDATTILGSDNIYIGGYLSPFDIALVSLTACGVCCYLLWDENYGESTSSTNSSNSERWYDGLRSALYTTLRHHDVLLCGIISSLFEGSMYIFVFMWTPALTSAVGGDNIELPFGVIFSTFMVCCMAGSSIFSILMDRYTGEQMAVGVFTVASASMAVVFLSSNATCKFLAMNLFETTVGMYFPIMGTLKGMIVPEAKRAAIYNLYRIPLNFIVLFSLLTDLTPGQSFLLNACMLGTAAVLQFVLIKKRRELSTVSDDSTELMEGLIGTNNKGSSISADRSATPNSKDSSV